jgi:hypothetical protein
MIARPPMALNAFKLGDAQSAARRRWKVFVGVAGMIERDLATSSIGPPVPIGMRCRKTTEAIRMTGLTLGVRNCQQITIRSAMFTMTGTTLQVLLIHRGSGHQVMPRLARRTDRGQSQIGEKALRDVVRQFRGGSIDRGVVTIQTAIGLAYIGVTAATRREPHLRVRSGLRMTRYTSIGSQCPGQDLGMRRRQIARLEYHCVETVTSHCEDAEHHHDRSDH